jgi:hypothetical protein
LLFIFGTLYKQKNRKRENKKNVRRKKNIIEKTVPEHPGNCRILIKEDQICKIEKFNSVFLTNECPFSKEDAILEEKFKIRCSSTQL